MCGAIAVTVLVALGNEAAAQDGEPARLDCTPRSHPAIAIRGDDVSRYLNGAPAAFRGFADPCLRRDTADGSLWLAYSWPHMEHLGGGPLDYATGVETHLARSTDGGRSWRRVSVLWAKTPANYTDQKTRIAHDGFVGHEAPNIVPCGIDGKPAWVGVRLDYFLARQGSYKALPRRARAASASSLRAEG